jgi:hypothetical protein
MAVLALQITAALQSLAECGNRLTVITPLPTSITQARESTLQSIELACRISAHHSFQNWKGHWQGGKDEDA